VSADPRTDEATEPPPARRPVKALLARHWPEVLAATALLAAIAVIADVDAWSTAALLALAPFAATAAVLDVRYQRIPTSVVVVAAVVVFAVLVVAALVTADSERLVRAVMAGGGVGIVYLTLWRFASMGMGDVRLAAALALVAGWIGWPAVIGFVVLPYVLMLPLAVFRLVRRDRRHVPFGPAIVMGLYAGVALAQLA
jgi:prepilin signal peptidase PulO-like enzyme (type II secretory pathway)